MFRFDQTFKALADPTRRRILAALRDGAQKAGDLAEALDIAPNALSFHLKALREAELVHDRREGPFIYYGLNTSVMEDLLRFMLDQFGGEAGTTDRSSQRAARGAAKSRPQRAGKKEK